MTRVLFQFQSSEPPTLARLVERFGFQPSDVDADYGFIEVDERAGLYVTLVEASARARVEPHLSKDDPATGFFSDPRVEPLQ